MCQGRARRRGGPGIMSGDGDLTKRRAAVHSDKPDVRGVGGNLRYHTNKPRNGVSDTLTNTPYPRHLIHGPRYPFNPFPIFSYFLNAFPALQSRFPRLSM